MKILTTTLEANNGNANVAGYSISQDSFAVKQSIGYLPEENPLYPEMYVKEYLRFNASVYKITNPKKRVSEVIGLTGLTKESGKKIKQLSKGYKQRVGLAAALLHQPKVLILDEPTTGLDPNQLVSIRKLIKEVAKNTTILLSTHIMQEVLAVCDRVIIINQGEIVKDADLHSIQKEEALQIKVEFDYKVEPELLKRALGTVEIKETSGFTYLLSFQDEEDKRGLIFDFAQENGLKILSLQKYSKSLESLFQELTQ